MLAPRPSSSLLARLLLVATLFFLLTTARSQGLDSDDPCAAAQGADAGAALCPINCFQPDPVCGVNGVTYWCGCPEAACAGVRVAKRGFCQVGNSGTGLLSGQAFLLVHIVWLFLLGFSVLFGLL